MVTKCKKLRKKFIIESINSIILILSAQTMSNEKMETTVAIDNAISAISTAITIVLKSKQVLQYDKVLTDMSEAMAAMTRAMTTISTTDTTDVSATSMTDTTDVSATDVCEAMDIFIDTFTLTPSHALSPISTSIYDAHILAHSRVFLEDCTNVFTKSEIEELIHNKHIIIDKAIKRDTSGQFVIVAPTTTCKCSIKEQILTQRNTHCKNCNKHIPIPINVIYEDFIKIENNILQVTVKTVETVETVETQKVFIFTHINKTLNEWIYHIPINIIFSVTVINYSRSKVQLTPIYIYGETKENFDEFDILTFESYKLNPNLRIEKDDLENGWELLDEKGKLVLKLCFRIANEQI